jgi:hypothetical protein
MTVTIACPPTHGYHRWLLSPMTTITDYKTDDQKPITSTGRRWPESRWLELQDPGSIRVVRFWDSAILSGWDFATLRFHLPAKFCRKDV